MEFVTEPLIMALIFGLLVFFSAGLFACIFICVGVPFVGGFIHIINYVTVIGNGSRELYLVIHALASNCRWKCYLNISNRKTSFFTKNQAPGILLSNVTLTYFLLCLNCGTISKRSLATTIC